MLWGMKALCLFLILVSSAFGGEREVWYGADGKAVRVIENGEVVKEDFTPQWEKREVEEPPREGVIQWDRRTSFSRRSYSPVYPYPGYSGSYYYGGGYGGHGWHGGGSHGWRGRGHYHHGGAGWGWSGVRIRIGN